MQKIPCLFQIDHEAHQALPELNQRAVERLTSAHEVRATRKRDGQAMLLQEDGTWMTRRAVNPGKTPPAGFLLAETDPTTGKSFGWEPVEASGVRKAFQDALAHSEGPLTPGSFELCGPKVQGNPEGFEHHILLRHGSEEVEFPPVEDLLTGDAHALLLPLFTQFHEEGMEGVVFWCDGIPAVKVRCKDFPELGLGR